MQRFKNVLFVIADSRGEDASLLKLAKDLRASGATLTLIEVMPEIPPSHRVGEHGGGLQAVYENVVKEHKRGLESRCAGLRKKLSGLKMGCVVREGSNHIEVIRQVLDGKHDLVVKVCGDVGLGGMLFSTLDMNLLRKCPCPVLLLRGSRALPPTRILAAVDLVRDTRSREKLDRVIVDLACSLAAGSGGKLDILHAWHLPYEKTLRSEGRLRGDRTMDSLLKELRQSGKQHLESLVEGCEGVTPGLHLVKGKPEEVIPRFAKSHRNDLVVMGTVGRTGLSGFFIGNTAENILRKLSCSVLAIKPEGFRTPVR